MARKSNRERLMEVRPSAKMTIPQLKKFIRAATKEINKGIKKGSLGDINLDKSLKFLKEVGGSIKGKLGLGFSKKKKGDLLHQANLLKSHMQIDFSTKEGINFVKGREDKARKSFNKNTGLKLTKTEYRNAVEIMRMIDKDVMELVGSDQVMKIFKEAYRKGNKKITPDSVAMVVTQEVYKAMNEGLTRSQVLDRIYKRLLNE